MSKYVFANHLIKYACILYYIHDPFRWKECLNIILSKPDSISKMLFQTVEQLNCQKAIESKRARKVEADERNRGSYKYSKYQLTLQSNPFGVENYFLAI